MLAYCLSRTRWALFARMRSGKNLVIIRAIKCLYKDKGGIFIVIAPLSPLMEWEKELTREHERYILARKTPLGSLREKVREYSTDSRLWIILNYEQVGVQLDVLIDLIEARKVEFVCLDESQSIRSPKAQRTKLVRALFKGIRYKAILSGTPNPESMLDFYEQLAFLYDGFMGADNYWEFRNKYYKLGRHEGDWYAKKGAQEEIRTAVHDRCFIMPNLPSVGISKVYETALVPMNKELARLYKEAETEFSVGNKKTMWILTLEMWLGRLAGGFSPETNKLVDDGKFLAVLEYLEGDLKEEQTVIWFRFNDELEYMLRLLQKQGIPAASITGETPLEARKSWIDNFNEKRLKVLLMQIKCGKYGIDLSGGMTSIYYSNSYSCEERYQSEERIIRLDKPGARLYLDMVREGTVDESIVDVLQNKKHEMAYFLSDLRASLIRRRGKELVKEWGIPK